jgi:hypothetical protein
MLNENNNDSNIQSIEQYDYFSLKENLEFDTTMGDNFKDFLMTNSIYVDKTLFIKKLIDGNYGRRIIINRPRRWGKSLNLSMLQYFFGIEVDENGKRINNMKIRNFLLAGI